MRNSVSFSKLWKQSNEFVFIEFPSTQFYNVGVDVEHTFPYSQYVYMLDTYKDKSLRSA
jgi:hypothetical protein